jgi:hypothetical protein
LRLAVELLIPPRKQRRQRLSTMRLRRTNVAADSYADPGDFRRALGALRQNSVATAPLSKAPLA